MKSVSTAVLLFVCVSLSNAVPQEAGSKKASISGIVLAADSNQPLPRATVSLANQGGGQEPDVHTVVTGPDGRFEFPDLKAGTYFLGAERAGYVRLHRRRRSTVGARVSVTDGQDYQDAVLKMVPGGVITGRVVDENGDPMSNMSVSALQYRYPMGRETLMPVNQAQTNDLGEYRIFGLQPGRYVVSVSSGGAGRFMMAGIGSSGPAPTGRVYAAMYYPDSLTRAGASSIEVRPGGEERADFHMAQVPAVSVRGRLLNVEPGERTHVQLVLLSENGATGNGLVKPDRSFEIRGVTPGAYVLMATSFDTSETRAEPRIAREPIVVGAEGLDGVELSLAATGGELQGRVRAEGPPIKFEQLVVVLVPKPSPTTADGGPTGLFGVAGRSGYARVEKDGTFKLKVPGPGSYDVMLNARGAGLEDWYTKTVHWGGRDVTASGLKISGRASGNLDIVVAADGGRLEGTVVDEHAKPVADATVVAVPDPPFRQHFELYQPAQSDSSGHFVIRGQRPGHYQVYAWDDVLDQAFFDPDFLKKYEKDGTSLQVGGNGGHQLVLKVIAVEDAD